VSRATTTRAQELAAAVRDFVAGAEEEARLLAYQVARDSMAEGVGVLEVVADHQDALALVLSAGWEPGEAVRWIRASSELLAESLGPFEMALRGFQESNAALTRMNEDLQREVAERRLAVEAARAAREEADSANRAKSEFLSRMSHELRTPLNAVLGFAQLLEMDAETDDQRESVEQIIRAGRHLLDLINEVLDISRIESGRLDVSVGPVSVDEVLREAMDLVRPLAADRGIRLAEPPASPSRGVLADRKRLRQVLLNLLSNAIKYNRDGGSVTASVEETGGGRVRVAIADTGLGISPDKLDRLFSPFDRVGAEETEVEGTGLGLALSLGLVDAMGGRIDVDSEVGVGTTFTVELPAA
jgi:signal transduction histidine kinase